MLGRPKDLPVGGYHWCNQCGAIESRDRTQLEWYSVRIMHEDATGGREVSFELCGACADDIEPIYVDARRTLEED